MRAVVLESVGGPEALQVRDVPMPDPGPGQVLVKVLAAGVNYIDVYHRTGLYPADLTFGLGLEEQLPAGRDEGRRIAPGLVCLGLTWPGERGCAVSHSEHVTDLQ